MRKSLLWFAAFTAVFAVCAAFALWGTWSLDCVPVMPDCNTNFRDWSSTVGAFFRGFVTTGKFVPDDLKVFLASPWVWVELQYVFAAYCAALGMAYFLKGKGLSEVACYGAGLLLAFSGYWFTLFSAGHLGWFRWMTYGVFAFGLIDRALPICNFSHFTLRSSLKHFVLLGACVAWGSFYQPDLWLLFTVFTGAYFIFRAWRAIAAADSSGDSGVSRDSIDSRKTRIVALGKGIAVAGVVFVLIGLPSFYSAFVVDIAGRDKQIAESSKSSASAASASEEKSDEDRWIFVTNWSLPPDEIAEAIVPRINGDTSCVLTQALGTKAGTGVRPYTGAIGRPLNAPSGNYRQHSLYIGFVTCLFALFGVIVGLKNLIRGNNSAVPPSASNLQPDTFFFAVAAMVFFAFACGRYFEPVYRIVYMLPFGDYLRAPVKWYHLFEFCIVVLAGFGIEAAARFTALRREGAAGGFMVKLPLAALVAVILVGAFDLVRVDHKFCAPVDMSAAKAKNAEMQMTFLPKQQFNHPQVAQMVKAGLIKSLAYYPGSRDVYLVGVLKPRGPKMSTPFPPWTLPTWLGVVSVITSFGVIGFAVTKPRVCGGEKSRSCV